MNLAVVRVAVALVAMLATACSSKEPATFTSTDPRTGDWFEVLAVTPDPAVVTDAEGRARMVATKLPWKVRDRKTGIVMLLCPPGKFLMGSPETEEDRRDDETQHKRVIRSAFYLSETEVTQDQWRMVMGTNPSFFKGGKNPVEQVSWNDCQRFCTATGLRLPNEAEWEYACRAGTTGAYAGDLGSMAWYSDNSGASTHPVATKAANPWGFYDMHGSVWEWVEDVYAKYPKDGGTEEAVVTGRRKDRVLRGGCWRYITSHVRSSSRDYDTPDYPFNLIGFRVARAPL